MCSQAPRPLPSDWRCPLSPPLSPPLRSVAGPRSLHTELRPCCFPPQAPPEGNEWAQVRCLLFSDETWIQRMAGSSQCLLLGVPTLPPMESATLRTPCPLFPPHGVLALGATSTRRSPSPCCPTGPCTPVSVNEHVPVLGCGHWCQDTPPWCLGPELHREGAVPSLPRPQQSHLEATRESAGCAAEKLVAVRRRDRSDDDLVSRNPATCHHQVTAKVSLCLTLISTSPVWAWLAGELEIQLLFKKCFWFGKKRGNVMKNIICKCVTDSGALTAIVDQDPHDQPKRRRIRKHKSKKKFKIFNNVHVEQAELEKQESLLQEKSQPWHTDGPTISKNKKRKLKKKQQIRRKKAAGLLTKASGVNFMYQPEESNSEQEDVRESSGEEVPAASEEGATEANEEDVRDASEEGATDAKGEDGKGTKEEGVTCAEEEDVKSTNEKADSILNFLKSTEEIYFYDGFSKDSDPAVFMETTEELFKHLETHSLSPSDVFILDHMKTLLLSQDTERLKSALELFPEHCMMPPDHANVVSAFFNYWITHILPEKNSE
ncbi:hypothetical protein HPG69_009534 [Diceros bicornis minor]|uniref:Glutamate-rich protein 1 n=1 Tax=Diceros bicornis minor TaxID=77932 RepID=A0A7J7F3P2_DICBM|nr:hypothetical protein HPG69_009534 [Diceros bicornis minor]